MAHKKKGRQVTPMVSVVAIIMFSAMPLFDPNVRPKPAIDESPIIQPSIMTSFVDQAVHSSTIGDSVGLSQQSLAQGPPPPLDPPRSISAFPDFMKQHHNDPQFADPEPRTCTITNSSLESTYMTTDYPNRYRPEQFLGKVHGSLNKAWKTRKSITGEPFEMVACFFFRTSIVHHFPHFLQQMLECWSLWERFPDANRTMVIDVGRLHQIRKHPFNRALLEMLKYANTPIYEMTKAEYVEMYGNTSDLKQLLVAQTFSFVDYNMANSDDLETFKQTLLESIPGSKLSMPHCSTDLRVDDTELYFNMTPAEQQQLMEQSSEYMPRIGILSRRFTRRLLQSQNISAAIKDRFGLAYTPPVYYYETFSMQEQIEAFQNIDIILTPHGAQESTLFFMPQCSSVIEVFPHTFDFRRWFGSLAALSNLNHTVIYLGKDIDEERKEAMKTLESRRIAREQLLCTPIDTILEALSQQIHNWRQRCGFTSTSMPDLN